jgi:hypothetical protein
MFSNGSTAMDPAVAQENLATARENQTALTPVQSAALDEWTYVTSGAPQFAV